MCDWSGTAGGDFAVLFIFGADRSRYGKLIENLENYYLQGCGGYPKSIQSAYNLLSNWKQDSMRNSALRNDGVSFTLESGTALTTAGKTSQINKRKVICHRIKRNDHIEHVSILKKKWMNEKWFQVETFGTRQVRKDMVEMYGMVVITSKYIL